MEALWSRVQQAPKSLVLTELVLQKNFERLLWAMQQKEEQVKASEIVSKRARLKESTFQALQRAFVRPGTSKVVRIGDDAYLETMREYSQTSPVSRRYYNEAIQGIKSMYRDWLFASSSQIDISNCNYSLLCGFLRRQYGDSMLDTYAAIYDYAFDRAPFISAVVEWVSGERCTPDEAKAILNGALFGANVKEWARGRSVVLPPTPHLINQFCMQISGIREMVMELPMVAGCFVGTETANVFKRTNDALTAFLTSLENWHVRLLIGYLAQNGFQTVLLVHDAIEVTPIMSGDRFTEVMRGAYDYLHEQGAFGEVKFHLKDKQASLESVEVEIAQYERMDAEEKTETQNVDDEEERVRPFVPMPMNGVVVNTSYGMGDSLCSNPAYLQMKKQIETDLGLVKVMHPLSFFYLLPNADGKPEYVRLTREQLLHTFENSRIRLPKRSESFVAIWLKDPSVRSYMQAGVYPVEEDAPANTLNLFRGLAVSKFEITDEDRQNPVLLDLRDAYFQHLRYLVDNEEHAQYWLLFLAHMFQFPKVKPRVCLVLQSYHEGVGKGLFEQAIRKILGENYSWYTAAPEEHVFGNFNGLVEGKFFGVIDENQVLKKDAVEKCKSLITNPDLVIRRMNTNPYTVPDYTRMIITTNSSQPVTVGQTDRRFVVSSTRNPALGSDRTAVMLQILGDKRVLRLIYEYLMHNVQVTADFAFDKCRPASIVYDEIKEMSTPYELRFFQEWFREICMHGIPSESATASYFRSPALNGSSSSSSVPSSVAGDKTFVIELGEFHKAYAEYMQKCHLEHHMSQLKFNTEMLRHLQVRRDVKEVNENGAAYYRVTSRVSNSYQKHIWVFSKHTMLDWFVRNRFMTAEEIAEL